MAAETIATPRGPVEIRTAGPVGGDPVLVVHGTPGGSDAGAAMGAFLTRAGFRVIAPSRPGYLGTPLTGDGGPLEQADVLAALLDALGLERVGLLAWSGGGLSGYALAARHPGRVRALAMAAAMSLPVHERAPLDELLFGRTRPGNRLMRAGIDRAPGAAVAVALKTEGRLGWREARALAARVRADAEALEFVLALSRIAADYPPRRAGVTNDWRWFGEAVDLGLRRIEAAALLVHGDADAQVEPAHSAYAAARIARAELLPMRRGTHMCLWAHPDARAAQARVARHLRR